MGKCEPEHETIHGRVTSARELRVHTILVGVSLTRDSSCFVVGEAVNKVGSARDKRLFCVLNASMKSLCGPAEAPRASPPPHETTPPAAMPRGEVAVGVPIHERLLALGPEEVFVGAEDAEIERIDGHCSRARVRRFRKCDRTFTMCRCAPNGF